MTLSAQQLLNTEFDKRRKKNPAYSLRAFARDLGISKTSLGDVINGQRKLSQQNIKILADSLGLSEAEMNALKADLLTSGIPRDVIEGDDLSLIEDWHYLAILNLARIKGALFSAEWVGERLGIPVNTASTALRELSERNLIEDCEGILVRKSKLLTTSTDIPSSSIMEHHRQSIDKALSALEEVEVELRDFTAVTYAINLKNLKEAKELILNFHRKLGKVLETEDAQEVYRLNIQFFPLTKVTNKENV